MVVMEALANGVPVIASRLGGVPEMVEDDLNGYLCSPADAAEFANRLRSLADDRQLVARLKAGARASAEAYLDAESGFARYESALREAIAYPRASACLVSLYGSEGVAGESANQLVPQAEGDRLGGESTR